MSKGEGVCDSWLTFQIKMTAHVQFNAQALCQSKFSSRHVSSFEAVNKTVLHAECVHAFQ